MGNPDVPSSAVLSVLLWGLDAFGVWTLGFLNAQKKTKKFERGLVLSVLFGLVLCGAFKEMSKKLNCSRVKFNSIIRHPVSRVFLTDKTFWSNSQCFQTYALLKNYWQCGFGSKRKISKDRWIYFFFYQTRLFGLPGVFDP